MNKHLLHIMNFLQQGKSMSEEEKNALIKSLKDADKEFEITSFKLDRTEKVNQTTAILLEETIEELEQKRKAVEAQNKELEIESSLERVRTVAMGMNKPDDMLDVCKTIALQLQLLGVKEIRNVQTAIFYEARGTYMNYEFYARHDKTIVTETVYTDHKVPAAFAEQMFKGKGEVYTTHIKGGEVKDWLAYQRSTNVFIDTYLENATSLNYYWHSLGPVALGISTYDPLSDDALQLFQRFLKVFDLSYRRYLDIEKAIAQAKEAQIETSLERVRAQAIAMRKPEDLTVICEILFAELQSLGFTELRNAMVNIFDDDKASFVNYDYSENAGKTITNLFYNTHPVIEKQVQQARTAADAFSEAIFAGADLADWKLFRKKAGELADPKVDTLDALFYYFYSIGTGVIGISTYSAITEEKREILKRFRNVFDFAYRRYMDVANAEAQAREAQIELALERVRARTMAMQLSDELPDAANILFQQMQTLGMPAWSAGYCTWDDDKKAITLWMSSAGIIQKPFRASTTEDPSFIHFYEAWKRGETFYAEAIGGEELVAHYKYMCNLPVVGEMLNKFVNEGGTLPVFQIFHLVFFSQGFLLFITYEPVPESHNIFKRFGNVFDQTYTRFLDLQKAEAQAKESQIEAALERVRSRTLAMQKSDELAETAAVLFQQLITLGIEPNRLYISIVKDDKGNAEFWITDEDGTKVGSAFETNLNDNPTFKRMFEGWRQEKKTLIIDMQGEELQGYFKFLTSIQVPFKGGLDQKRRIQDIAYFSKGFIGMASPDEQPVETLQLLERFAAVFNLTFTRFNDLKVAEAHAIQAEEDLIKLQTEKKRAEDALGELRATQTQLIQSEKMASLGELTAGIAHEIQNPLNFVNNFSEVSNELIDEMYAEIEKGDMEEAKAIADDIKQNLEKINHHGRRADAIVKGMLQHSRSSSATKELTDINKLADKYLRLAYHGLRAKDKSFNAILKTGYDETIGNVNIIPQDIGRVVLNLITNAFYAVNEKKKAFTEKSSFGNLTSLYEPTVSVSTKKLAGKIEILVSDNGNGIPQNIIDKIFQPFFTTKPTGQGTGLGLSLAYDIVKAHAGELKVETKQGEGSSFIIQIPYSTEQ